MRNALAYKKRDTYLSAAATGANPSPENPVVRAGAISLRPASQNQGYLPNFHALFYCPTFRYLKNNAKSFVASRSATRPFYIGLSETYSLYPNDNSMWFWRRIVFSTKRNYGQEISPTAASQIGVEASDGATTQRPMRDISGDASVINYGQMYTNIAEDVFEGIYTTDWQNPIQAHLDRTKVSVISDKRRTITSHNDVARPAVIKAYVPINKTVVYGDEENGNNMSTSPVSVTSKSGMGNIYVLDFFHCPAPVGDTTRLNITSQSTMYWHEK